MVRNHQRHFMTYGRLVAIQYRIAIWSSLRMKKKRTVSHRSSEEKYLAEGKKKVNFSLRSPAVSSFFYWLLFSPVVVPDDDSMSSLLVIKPTFIIRYVMCMMRSSIYSPYIRACVCISKLILLLIDPCPHRGHWQIYHHRFYLLSITANDSKNRWRHSHLGNFRFRSREVKLCIHMNSPPMAKCERSLASNDAYQSVGSSRSSLF